MGYRKIANLYKPWAANHILSLGRCYALEKVHGTSGHISLKRTSTNLNLFAGGCPHDDFVNLVERKWGLDKLRNNIWAAEEALEFFDEPAQKITIFGEIYGGKMQAMESVYGPLNFVAFEVRYTLVNDKTYVLSVPDAHIFVNTVGLPFVPYEEGPSTVEWLNEQRDRPSELARRNGMGVKYGEGIVIRPLVEQRDEDGKHIIAKHKTNNFKETRTPRKIDPQKQRLWRHANEVANEFVVLNRLEHVLDAMRAEGHHVDDISCTGDVVRRIFNDIKEEEGDEIEWTKEVNKAIGRKGAKLFQEYIMKKIR